MKTVFRSLGVNRPEEEAMIGLVGHCPVLARKNGELSGIYQDYQLLIPFEGVKQFS